MQSASSSAMVPLAVMVAVTIMCVNGRPLLSMKDCFLVTPEVELFRVEGEAVIIAFPIFQRVLQIRNIATSPTTKITITKGNRTGGVTFDGEGRVQQHDRQLWLLPAQASDSGEYTCFYRNDTYCIAGSITLQVYESNSLDMENLCYPIFTRLGQTVTVRCPSLSRFNRTDHIEWYKEPSPTDLNTAPYHSNTAALTIPEALTSHQGFYTCQLTVLINNQQYRVSRTIQLHVEGGPVPVPDPLTPKPTSDLSMTSDPNSLHSTTVTPVIQPPVIVSPLNGSIFKTTEGSGLELSCKAFTGCQMADSTMVTWLVNGQSVESSFLDGRALQGERRVTMVSGGCQVELRLVVMVLTEEDTRAEIKCVTQNQGGKQEIVTQLRLEDSMFSWVVVIAVILLCFLTVVSVFLYFLLKPKRKMDYMLARQSSVF